MSELTVRSQLTDKELPMGFDRDVPNVRIWYWRLQGVAFCLLAELALAVAWVVYQVLIGAATIGRYN